MHTARRRGRLAHGAFSRGRARCALAGFTLCAVLAIPASANAETKYGGWYEVNTPLSIRPDTGPVERALWSGDPIMFVDMPVTKEIATVTLGDLRNGPYCSRPANVDLIVAEHPNGDPFSTPTRQVRSTTARALTGTQSRVTWSIPTTRFRKGVGYSFILTPRTDGCSQVRYTTWLHTQSSDVNAGTNHCATSATLLQLPRVWHRQGEGATTPCGGHTFDASMPTGWLAARPNPYGGGSYIMTASFSTTPNTACVVGPDGEKYGGRWVPWRADPQNTSATQHVCIYTQYKPLNVTDNNGFYYALPWIGSGTNGAPRDMFLELGTIDYRALLEARKPLLKYDRDEQYFADSAAAMTDAPENSLRRQYVGLEDPEYDDYEHGWVTIADNTGAVADLNLLNLAAAYPGPYAFQLPDPDRDMLVAGGDHYANASTLHAGGYGNQIYGRPVYDSDGDLWLQYWFFYYYNSHEYVNVGPHPGDWEMIQIRLNESLQPVDVTYAQHKTAERCDFDYVASPNDPARPVVYVADGSHASYTSAGESGLPFGATDHHWGDRLGGAVDPSLNTVTGELHNFWGWPGRWGQDTGEPSESPKAPKRQGDRWSDPLAFHDDSDNRDCPSLSAASRTRPRRRRGADGVPRVRIIAADAGARIRVRYRIAGRLPTRRGFRLRVVAHTTDPDDMPTSKYVPLRGQGTVSIRVPRGVASYIVSASAYNKKGERGTIKTVRVR